MTAPDLFAREKAALSRAKEALEQGNGEIAHRALADLAQAFDRMIRDTGRLINHADRTERELNRANQKLRELTEELTFRSRHDGLTGLLNRETFIGETVSLMASGTVILLLLDIDHFKQVNDRYGHPVGDRVIVGVARVLCARAPGQALCGRLGGEEFAILLPHGHWASALHLAEDICGGIRDIREPAHPGLRVTASMSAAASAPGTRFDTLYVCADDALYRAKSLGRDRIETVADWITPDA
ncbi:diguanylate cyclase [Ectothiorhodospira haloalkaliphila]|uniref:diguanylate cyclase n=1 Tax=Ectothiorhodospira haloalkaliphila TaxID=421628 RepID=W8KWP1_9GAMM|nr:MULTISPECIES: GGDEF domain-containing protein [Ectothiorhodospira]AHK79986.1 diguanylate cyclase [Ectothiorhodospira haloalkaliphila]MCG5496977.1 GGDEF domain-containing protein [Ectothiorhodospira variabilis]MCG5525120.1 GGDEF domain-containing protein [Ectothiorhodospira haloalkaliphila]